MPGRQRRPNGVAQSSPPANATGRWEIISGDKFIEQYCRCSRYLRRWPCDGPARKSVPASIVLSCTIPPNVEMWLRLACTGSVAKTDLTQGIRRVHEQQVSR